MAMRKVLFQVAYLAIALAFCASGGAAQDVASRPEASQIGRYQIAAAEERIFVLDTATGQCWGLTQNGTWLNEGNPTKMKEGKRTRTPDDELAKLELPDTPVELTVIQREERAIPGSDGSVRIRLGDITDGQALLAVVTADGEFLLERTSISQDDALEFEVGKRKYKLHIHELRNVLIGDDFAKIRVSEASSEASEKN